MISNFQSKPRRGAHIRRRKVADCIFLINGSKQIEIGGLPDRIWTLCNGETPIPAIVMAVAEYARELTQAEAAQKTVNTLDQFRHNDLLFRHLGGSSGMMAESPITLPRCPAFDALQQVLFRKDYRWNVDISKRDADKIFGRLWRIIYECDAAFRNVPFEDDDEFLFRERLIKEFQFDPAATATHLINVSAIRWWNFDIEARKIEVVMQRSVYIGSIDHRH